METNIYRPEQSSRNEMVYRLNPERNRWEFWGHVFGKWYPSVFDREHNPIADDAILLQFDDTWAEPIEEFRDA
jgi:hypothetical protein